MSSASSNVTSPVASHTSQSILPYGSPPPSRRSTTQPLPAHSVQCLTKSTVSSVSGCMSSNMPITMSSRCVFLTMRRNSFAVLDSMSSLSFIDMSSPCARSIRSSINSFKVSNFLSFTNLAGSAFFTSRAGLNLGLSKSGICIGRNTNALSTFRFTVVTASTLLTLKNSPPQSGGGSY